MSDKSENEERGTPCNRCGKVIKPGREKMLAYSRRTFKHYDPKKEHPAHANEGFTYGKDCARAQLKEDWTVQHEGGRKLRECPACYESTGAHVAGAVTGGHSSGADYSTRTPAQEVTIYTCQVCETQWSA